MQDNLLNAPSKLKRLARNMLLISCVPLMSLLAVLFRDVVSGF